MWKKLLKLSPLAMQLARMDVNSGSTASFWFDRWSSLGTLIELTGERETAGVFLLTVQGRVQYSYIGQRDIELLSCS